MSSRKKVNTKIETEKTELEATMNTNIYELKTKIKDDNTTTFNSLDMKLPDLTSSKTYS